MENETLVISLKSKPEYHRDGGYTSVVGSATNNLAGANEDVLFFTETIDGVNQLIPSRFRNTILEYSKNWDRNHETVHLIMDNCGIQNNEEELHNYFKFLEDVYRKAELNSLYQDIIEQMCNAVNEIFLRISDGFRVDSKSIYFTNKITFTCWKLSSGKELKKSSDGFYYIDSFLIDKVNYPMIDHWIHEGNIDFVDTLDSLTFRKRVIRKVQKLNSP
ncbi:hypothetical protein [Paenibacillus periandrae]|uniref:hypothetical protein n=1 Tax=Paenibacillus periandrae TaxID=1761741 RepID=UPI001F093C7A|nr:hypothetical protein [Paenibacillus periandrae]